MRTVFFGQTGPYAPVALREIIRRGLPLEIVLVVEGKKRHPSRGLHKLHAANGPPGSAASLPTDPWLLGLARHAGLPVLESSDVNSKKCIDTVARHEPELLVCFGFDRLFAPALIDTASLMGINAHPSWLPDLRGPSPIFWALRRGDARLGVSIHRLEKGEDDGPVFAQGRFEVPSGASGEHLFGLAGRLGVGLLEGVLDGLRGGTAAATPQDHARATRAPRPKREDALIDPAEWGGEKLLRFASGAPFFATPWLRLGEDAFFVRRGIRFEPGRHLPAQYVQQGDALAVACRDGVVHLTIQV